MSKQRAKGTAAETAVVRFLQDHGFPYAERRALHGTNDKGDITGLGPVVLEVKNCQRLELSEWLHELEAEMYNARAETGAVVAKRRGTTDPAGWYAILPFGDLVELLLEAGFGDKR
jgi:hypothetical protein